MSPNKRVATGRRSTAVEPHRTSSFNMSSKNGTDIMEEDIPYEDNDESRKVSTSYVMNMRGRKPVVGSSPASHVADKQRKEGVVK